MRAEGGGGICLYLKGFHAMPHVVIVGAGFGGLAAAKALINGRTRDTSLTLIDQRNHHLFQPLLYQVATAGLSPAEIAAPIRSLLRAGVTGIEVLMERVSKVTPAARTLTLEDGRTITYDRLILACGASHSYFGHDDWEEFAPGLKTLEQATEIRRRILLAFERAESTVDAQARREFLTFVIVGAGPTGVELAGSVGEISRQILTKDFSHIDPTITRIILIEAGPRILPAFSPELSRRAMRDLEGLGVTVWTSMRVTKVGADGVHLGEELVRAKTVVWAAGVRASPLGAMLGGKTDNLGRIEVDEMLNVKGVADVFAIGDMALCHDAALGVLPGLAPVAMQQGRAVARNVLNSLAGRPLVPFRYTDKGLMATIGRKKAVTEFHGLKLTGHLAWLAWLAVHIYYLIGFRSRLFVLLQWVSSYMFFKRGARLITDGKWRSAVPPS